MENLYANILKEEVNVNLKNIEASKSKNLFFFLNPSSNEMAYCFEAPSANVNSIYIKKTEAEIEEYKIYLEYLDLICKAAKAINVEQSFEPNWTGNNDALNQKKYFLYFSFASGNIAVDYTYEYVSSPLPPCVTFKDQTTANNFIGRLRSQLQYVFNYQFKM